MFRSAPVGVVVKELGLQPAVLILNNRQRKYALRSQIMPRDIATREILPETLREGDIHAQLGEQKFSNWDWLSTSNAKNLGQPLANSLVQSMESDTSFDIEDTDKIRNRTFPGTISVISDTIEAKRYAIEYETE